MGWIRPVVRILVLAVAVTLALQCVPGVPAWTASILPGLSPFVGACSALAARRVTWWALLAVPVLVMALLRGRWFCRNACPMGLLAEYAGRARTRPPSLAAWPRLGPWIVVLALAGAAAGSSFLLLCLDPLSIFNGFVGTLREPVSKADLFLAAGFAGILALSLWRPGAWCFRLCPLGAVQDLLGAWRQRSPSKACGCDRRGFLGLVLCGAAAGWAMRKAGREGAVIRPPGAAPEDQFHSLCVRCGNCLRSCPERILRADAGGSGWSGLLTPVALIEPSYCSEFCNACATVCPSGAIRRMSLEEKRCVAIGTAEVLREKCLAWGEHKYCMVCSEFCPFHAVRVEMNEGVNCPIVEPDICRGCGLCQVACPALERAILIRPQPQRVLKAVEMWNPNIKA